MSAPAAHSAPPNAATPCSRCHGVGTMLISLCCGRGCTNCVGDGFREIECPRCHGSGHVASSPNPAPAR